MAKKSKRKVILGLIEKISRNPRQFRAEIDEVEKLISTYSSFEIRDAFMERLTLAVR